MEHTARSGTGLAAAGQETVWGRGDGAQFGKAGLRRLGDVLQPADDCEPVRVERLGDLDRQQPHN